MKALCRDHAAGAPGLLLGAVSIAAAVACGSDTDTSAASSTSATASVGSSSGGGGTGATSSVGAGGYQEIDPLAGTGQVELVQGGFSFTEGPVWLPTLGMLRFSDIPASRIHEYDPASGMVTTWREPSANTNGNGLGPNGEMLMCEHAGRRVSRSPATGAPAPTTVADNLAGDAFNSPNDVIARSDGTVYFTDPTYGLTGMQQIAFQGVFRVAPGGQVAVVDDTHAQPNGIALSPDETRLYVSDSEAGGLRVYDVAPDGSTGMPTELIAAASSDGMAVDDAGNLYLTTAAGVEVYRPDGSAWGVLAVPEQPANCTFGSADRRTLFITARTGLYRITLNIPGKP